VIPALLVRATIDREGAAGRAWIEALPGLVDQFLERWNCTRDGDVLRGQVGVVVPVRLAQGSAVLKISFPHPGNVAEPLALAALDGRGAVRLLERDDEQFAMLLERARQETLEDLGSTDEALVAAGRLARRLAVAAPPEIPRLEVGAVAWEQQMLAQDNELGHPMPARVIDAALDTIRAFGADQTDTLMHGDLHFANVLRGEREAWLAIDPKGLAGSAAYDAATIIRDRPAELLGAADLRKALIRRIEIFSDAAEVDRDLALGAAQARMVSSALWERQHGQPRVGVELAERVASLLAS